MEDHGAGHAELLGPGLEHQAIGLALARHDVRVGGAQDDVDRVGMGREDGGQRVDDVLDALVGRQQPEGENHGLALDAEAVLAPAARRHLRDAVRNQVDLPLRDAVHALQQLRAGGAHHHQPLREPRQLVDHHPLRRVGLRQDGVQRGDDGHPQVAQQRQHVRAGLAAEDAVLVLHAEHVHLVHVEEVGRAMVGGQVALVDLEPHARRVGMTPPGVVHGQHEAVGPGHGLAQRVGQVRGEGGDAAVAGQVVAEQGKARDRCGIP